MEHSTDYLDAAGKRNGLWQLVRSIWEPSQKRDPADWAADNRVYPETAGIPGPRDPWLTPYMIPWSSAVHNGGFRRVVAVTSAQSGKTDSMLDIIGARLDQRPAPIIYVGPTKEFLTDQFEPRLMGLLDEAESLKNKVVRGRRMKKTLKHVAGVRVRLAHAGSSSALKSDPAALALIDEFDEMMANVKGQGDVLGLVEARGETYADFVTAITSTPARGLVEITLDEESGLEFWSRSAPEDLESPIWKLWQEGTRHHWAWPCKHCNEYFIPRFKQLHWPDRATPAQAKRSTYLVCPRCGGIHTNDDKAWMNERGAMVAPGQSVVLKDDRPFVSGAPEESSTLSMWTSGLCSPFVTWGQRAETYLTALQSGDHDRIQTAMNASFGECYSMTASGDVPEWQEIMERRLPYQPGQVPSGGLRLVMGVDVQKFSLVYVIRAFGSRGSSWLVDNGQLYGPTEDDEVWTALADLALCRIAVDRRGRLHRRDHLRGEGAQRPHRGSPHREDAMMGGLLTSFFSGIGRRVALWAALAAAILIAMWTLVRRGRLEAEADLAIRRADARIRSMRTAKETRHEVRNADRADLDRRADRWMRDGPPPPSR